MSQSNVTVTPFDPNNHRFNMRALSLLEAAAGIPVMRTLSDYTQHIQSSLGLVMIPILDLNALLNYWIGNAWRTPPTWEKLLDIIRQLNLDELAQRMETYLSGEAEEFSPIREQEGKRRVSCFCGCLCIDVVVFVGIDKSSSDGIIYQLKQQMATMQQRIEDLVYKNEELKDQLTFIPIKKEGTHIIL